MPVQFTKSKVDAGTVYEVSITALQPVGAPASMGFSIQVPEGERAIFYGGRIGKNNYAAGRTINGQIFNLDSSNREYLMFTESLDNQEISLGHLLDPAAAPGVNNEGLPSMPYEMFEGQEMRILGASLVNAETLSGRFYFATRAKLLDIGAIGTGVTLSVETQIQA